VTFTDGDVRVYEGTGDTRACEPTSAAVTIGNFRIIDVRLPNESNLDYVGLVMPFRGLLNERGADLDRRWGSDEGLALICEMVDPAAPIGFRMRAHARRRMLHSPGAWLELNLARHAHDDDAIPATARNRRFGGDMQHWYIESDLPTIYDTESPESDRFAIVLDAGGRGSFWIKWIEIKPWPTMLGR
jgi:hypothetical protein